jgi:hypothetical protein
MLQKFLNLAPGFNLDPSALSHVVKKGHTHYGHC